MLSSRWLSTCKSAAAPNVLFCYPGSLRFIKNNKRKKRESKKRIEEAFGIAFQDFLAKNILFSNGGIGVVMFQTSAFLSVSPHMLRLQNFFFFFTSFMSAVFSIRNVVLGSPGCEQRDMENAYLRSLTGFQ